MKSPDKYIIIVCDEPQWSETVTRLFQDCDGNVALARNEQELLGLLEKKIPSLIVVHLVSGTERYVTYLKDLRKNRAIDNVPVMVYSVLPDRAEIQKLFEGINADESANTRNEAGG